MKPFSIVIGALGLVVSLAIIPARAQNSDRDRPRLVESSFDLQPGLTKDKFDELAAEVGSVLRFLTWAAAAAPPIDMTAAVHPAVEVRGSQARQAKALLARVREQHKLPALGGCRPRY